MKSFMANAQNIERKWYVVDAEGVVLGRLASQVASILRGKNKPTYTPHVDTGDYVIIVNADKIVLTGNKLEDKMYYKHSHYPGGLKESNAKTMLARHPEFPVWDAVRGMLPHTPLGAAMLDKLHVYAGPNHPHQAQQPEELKL